MRIAALAADGSLAYWMDDFPAARAAYQERLELATASGDPRARWPTRTTTSGSCRWSPWRSDLLRDHEQQALDLYLAAGREDGWRSARGKALVLAMFLAG